MNAFVCSSIINSTKDEIILSSREHVIRINLNECAKNFSLENGTKSSKCVATRNITELSFIFYTQPKTKVVFKKHFINKFINRKSATKQFSELQKEIIRAGYTSYDLS